MSSPAVRLLASRLARAPGYSRPNNTSLFKVGPQGPKQPYRPPPSSLGGPIQKQPSGLQGGWNDSLAKEPVFRSPGLKHPSKGTPITRWSNQPYRF